MTDWGARELAAEKLKYAAFDAFAAAYVYDACGGAGGVAVGGPAL